MLATPSSHIIEHYGYLVQMEMLLVKIKDNSLYAYKGVTLECFRQMLRAPSVGKFFLREVRERFHYERVAPTAYIIHTAPDAPAPRPPPLTPVSVLDALAHVPDAWL